MRYAENLVQGNGLVWNPGDRVEGITNPAWTFLMAIIQNFVPSKWDAPLAVELLSTLCVACAALLAAQIARRISGGSSAAGLAAFMATAFFFPLNFFSIYGMETGALALVITGGVALWLRDESRALFPWRSYFLLGIALCIRMDAVVALAALWIWALITSRKYWRRHLLFGAATLLLVPGAQTALRLAFYGAPLPNTYYLKMTGFPLLQRIARGGFVALISLRHPLLPALAAIAVIAWINRRSISHPQALRKISQSSTTPLVVVVLAQVSYSIFVGGDAWEADIFMNRYLVVAAPILFAVMAYLFVTASRDVLAQVPGLADRRLSVRGINPHFINLSGGLVLGLLMTVWLNCPPNYGKCTRQAMFIEKPLVVPMAESHAHLAKMLDTITEPSATIAIDAAGSLPYYLDRRFYDILGKSDAVVAHEPMHTFAASTDIWYKVFYPGHMKWDAAYTAGELKPDIIFMEWFAPYDAFLPYIKANYIYLNRGQGAGIFVRKGSSRIHWNKIPEEWLSHPAASQPAD
jgi:hypothetical protein